MKSKERLGTGKCTFTPSKEIELGSEMAEFVEQTQLNKSAIIKELQQRVEKLKIEAAAASEETKLTSAVVKTASKKSSPPRKDFRDSDV